MATPTAGAPQVYGADEVNAVVLDPGSYTTKIGYAGEDCPNIVLPSYYGEYEIEPESKTSETDAAIETLEKKYGKVLNETMLSTPRPGNYEIKPILKENIIVDWEGAMSQYDFMFDELRITPEEQPLLMTQSTLNTYDNKSKALEYFLEEKNFCAFYMVHQPTCVSFAHGRPNCLIVDIGHDLTTVTPIIDGICLKKQVLGTSYAGSYLNQELLQLLSFRKTPIVPHYKVKSKSPIYWNRQKNLIDNVEVVEKYKLKDFKFEITKSFDDFQNLKVLNEMKETLIDCEIFNNNKITDPENTDSDNKDFDPTSYDNPSDDTRYYELPNGINIPFNKYERTRLGDTLFNPSLGFTGDANEKLPIVKGWERPQEGDILNYVGNKGEKSGKEYVPLRRAKKVEDEEKMEVDGEAEANEKEARLKEGLDKDGNPKIYTAEEMSKAKGITNLIHQLLSNLDIDIKPQLANNIIVTGASSLIPGLTERINSELSLLNPSLKIRIHSSGSTVERKYAAWIGGSILASLGTFHQLWVSKAEYEEVGASRLIVSRFR
ncbi:hypothetical protein BVG19_g5699 [[Candida] boidinii]|nr:hypothetical protein BVG19_g5699 [[Candida] boidinii]OWB53196.1 hypothetical protein B5S27_g4788 [[Candida] boidinii]OWB85751.1 hypothetical protein B5S33_g4422 [[Candida] boidinii]